MFRLDCTCRCGRSFSTYTEEGAMVTCPYCGRKRRVASEEKETARNENGLSLEEATSEIVAQGGLPFSGAR